MKIILVQAEIEAAITAYVLGQISVAEGHQITIDFKNTRGADGATAEIDISKPVPLTEQGAATQAAIVNHFRKPAADAQTTIAATAEPVEEVSADQGGEAPATEENPSEAPAVQNAADGDSTSTTEAVSAEPATTATEALGSPEDAVDIKRTVPFDADQPVDEEVPADKPQTKSLFANMQRRNATA